MSSWTISCQRCSSRWAHWIRWMSIDSISICCSFDLLGSIEVVLTIQQSISLCVTTLRVFFSSIWQPLPFSSLKNTFHMLCSITFYRWVVVQRSLILLWIYSVYIIQLAHGLLFGSSQSVCKCDFWWVWLQTHAARAKHICGTYSLFMEKLKGCWRWEETHRHAWQCTMHCTKTWSTW